MKMSEHVSSLCSKIPSRHASQFGRLQSHEHRKVMEDNVGETLKQALKGLDVLLADCCDLESVTILNTYIFHILSPRLDFQETVDEHIMYCK